MRKAELSSNRLTWSPGSGRASTIVYAAIHRRGCDVRSTGREEVDRRRHRFGSVTSNSSSTTTTITTAAGGGTTAGTASDGTGASGDRFGSRPGSLQRGYRCGVLEPALDPLVVVVATSLGRGRGGRRTLWPPRLVRLAVQGQQFGLETFQEPGRREFRLPVRVRFAEHAPRVYDKQQVPLGPFRPAETAATGRVVRHGHAGRARVTTAAAAADRAGRFFFGRRYGAGRR